MNNRIEAMEAALVAITRGGQGGHVLWDGRPRQVWQPVSYPPRVYLMRPLWLNTGIPCLRAR